MKRTPHLNLKFKMEKPREKYYLSKKKTKEEKYIQTKIKLNNELTMEDEY